MLIPQTGAIPPGGWHFIDRTGGVERRFNGISPFDLAVQVLRYRTENSLQPGDPSTEIADYVCSNWPGFCLDTNPPAPAEPQSGGGLPSTRTSAWIASFFGWARFAPKVAEAVACGRAETCVQCPHNAEYRAGCQGCLDNIERLSFIWRAGRGTPYDAKLGACGVIGQHNATAVWADLPELAPAVRDSLPAQCWRKR